MTGAHQRHRQIFLRLLALQPPVRLGCAIECCLLECAPGPFCFRLCEALALARVGELGADRDQVVGADPGQLLELEPALRRETGREGVLTEPKTEDTNRLVTD